MKLHLRTTRWVGAVALVCLALTGFWSCDNSAQDEPEVGWQSLAECEPVLAPEIYVARDSPLRWGDVCRAAGIAIDSLRDPLLPERSVHRDSVRHIEVQSFTERLDAAPDAPSETLFDLYFSVRNRDRFIRVIMRPRAEYRIEAIEDAVEYRSLIAP